MSSRRIAVLGENLVDLLVAADGSVNAVIGGGPLNVARTIGRLGGDVHFVSGLSGDAFGALIRASLVESGVDLSMPRPLAQPTTLAVVELNPAGPQYHFHLHDTAAFTLDGDETAAALGSIKPLAAMYFGTLGLLVEPMASLGEVLVRAAGDDTVVVIDPNCRPSAVEDHDGYRSRVARLCSRADVVKVSTEDLEYLYGDRSYLDGAQDIVRLGARCVIVTDGAQPVTVLGTDFRRTIDVAPAEVVDTVGAGDALVGAFMAWWSEHEFSRDDLHHAETVTRAVAASVEISRLTCQRPGAQPPRRREVRGSDGW